LLLRYLLLMPTYFFSPVILFIHYRAVVGTPVDVANGFSATAK
jgi:hypothetical protein